MKSIITIIIIIIIIVVGFMMLKNDNTVEAPAPAETEEVATDTGNADILVATTTDDEVITEIIQ
jgi:preprotein translocase subunit SecG